MSCIVQEHPHCQSLKIGETVVVKYICVCMSNYQASCRVLNQICVVYVDVFTYIYTASTQYVQLITSSLETLLC